MREVTPETAAVYLHETGRVANGRALEAQALGWGVSNVVIRVDVDGEPPIVLKQARERLRTQAHWVSRLDRIWTERAALELLDEILPAGTVPRVLFSDEDNYLFAMSCAPLESVVWKQQLLEGTVDAAIARRAGEVLGTIHASTHGDHPALNGRLSETEVFDQLRVDPFYRTVARAHPSVAGRLAALIYSMAPDQLKMRTLVLGDFSPKNILVYEQGITLVDFETAHVGDPAFDLGFFLSHLLLKTIRVSRTQGAEGSAPYYDLMATFRAAYDAQTGGHDVSLDLRAATHAAACSLARVDGTSPVDYLDLPARDAVRRIALTSLAEGPEGWDRLVERVREETADWGR